MDVTLRLSNESTICPLVKTESLNGTQIKSLFYTHRTVMRVYTVKEHRTAMRVYTVKEHRTAMRVYTAKEHDSIMAKLKHITQKKKKPVLLYSV